MLAVTIFGHHITSRFALLACLDSAALLLTAHSLELLPNCAGCFVESPVRLDPIQTILLTGFLLLTATSVGLYNNDAVQDFRVFAKRFLLVWQLLFIPLVAAYAVTKIGAGSPFGWRAALFPVAVTAFVVLLFALHGALAWWLGLSFMKTRVLVLGAGAGAQAVTEFLNGPGRSHFNHVQTISHWRAADNVPPRIGNVVLAVAPSEPAALSRFAEMLRTDEIVVTGDDKQAFPVTELLECKLRGIKVVDALTFWEREAGLIDASQIGPEWLAFSSGFVFDQPHRFLKRTIDLIISAAFLIFVLPMCLLVALAIRLESRGPVFYRQERVGLNGRVFQLWKFRSMRADAEKDGVPRWAATADDRVTRVGHFIRMVRIDEIPQVINVLAGDMSFIGPRPERPFFVEQLRELLPNYDLRHRVRPGITGWAQVNYPYGASIEDAKRKLSYDLFYLKKNDILLDLAILVQTVRVVLFAHGAR
ncbi:MAG TPA: TIGR03013 family XrtA/PEP-CTERM system glycosyltransferase [Phenylobacterium sp.]|nr:TIGR03013 family XrtA/PEP-CTERM system glycosyltransferase [Phenylobacterium sp.]HEX4710781.1 TIGR03013 family XrtA/PEP-CTERM system glycosyltransferase [Phenylobacterium sp.]